MNKKLIFRILGALASALIIVSVFVPFVSVTGYTSSLWESYNLANALYLPIMIIVFGAIGVVFFALNIKTEFAYMSTGAISFFLVMETIDVLNQGVFNTLSLGYYFLVVGTVLTGVMAFLTNLKSNKKEKKEEPINHQMQPSMLDQIDKLYNDQTTKEQIQTINNVVEPISVQPIEPVTPIQPINPLTATQEITPVKQVAPVIQEQQVPVTPIVTQQPVNPVVQEFAQPVNPVVQEFNIPTPNPTVQQPVMPQVPQQTVQPLNVQPPTPVSNTNVTNPVVQEFTNPGSTVTSSPNTAQYDIFGQPINK